MAIVFLAGTGRCGHSLSRSRTYSEGLAPIGQAIGLPEYRVACAAVLIPDDYDIYERGAVAVSVLRQPGVAIVAGYLQRSLAERFRREVAENDWPDDAALMCQGVFAGYTVQYKKGPMHHVSVLIDICWPLRAAPVVPPTARTFLP